jgi:hypothetical protein
LVCNDYLTKSIDVQSLWFAKDDNVAKFLYEDVFTRYGVPKDIVIDQGPKFKSDLNTKLV